MKSSNQLMTRMGNENDRQHQLHRKHTFGSVGNFNPQANVNSATNKKPPLPSIQTLPQAANQSSNSFIKIQVQKSPNPSRKIKTSSLSTAISSLTYGLSCLIYETESNQVYECLMMAHQEYINILHIIINRQISYLLKLHDVKSITDQDTFIAAKLSAHPNLTREMKENYIVLNLKSLKSIVLVFRTQNQKDIILLGLRFFLNQGKLFYSKLSQYDPFKAQSMMLFLEADKDGGDLLDIEQIISILSQLKISKQKIDIEADVLQINKSLYERENMKRPKNASSHQLTPIAFEYMLRYYSIKEQLAKFFKQYCPMFKPKTKNHKNTIIDIIKNNQKPIMSSVQLKEFYREMLNEEDKSQEEFDEIIRKFPVYDGQGKEKFDVGMDDTLLSFDNFCNLVCSKENSLCSFNYLNYDLAVGNKEDSQLLNQNQGNKLPKDYLSYSLLDYHIYTDLSLKNPKRKEKSNYFTLALKRGVKCISLNLNLSMCNIVQGSSSSPSKTKTPTQKLSALVVRVDEKEKQEFLLDDILRDVKTYAFQKNTLPFFIVLDIDSLFNQTHYQKYLQLLNQVIEDTLDKQSIYIYSGNKDEKKASLPSPMELQHKIIFLSTFNAKLLQKSLANKEIELPKTLARKITFNGVKLDFERKGQNCWNCCFVTDDSLKNYQTAEEQNISNYAKKLMLFCSNNRENDKISDSFPCFRQGIHFVGENFQKNKESNYVLHSKFSQLPEEYFGYRLKPDYMHSQNPAPLYSNKNFTRTSARRIKFNILSGQKLILNDLPFNQFHVEVCVKGSASDEKNNKTFKSDKKSQGFYTEINLQCEFLVYNEDIFTIVVVVKNSENNKILAARAASLKQMREGLRTLQLFNQRMQTKENSYLLVHHTKKNTMTKDQKANKMHQFLK